MKKPETILREFVSKANDDTLKYISGRLSQRLGGDVGDALNELSINNDLDRWLNSAKSAWELYDMVDLVAEYVEREAEERSQEENARNVVETDEDGNVMVRKKRFSRV